MEMNNMQYTWDWDKDAETWYNGPFNSIEQCIEDARQNRQYDWQEVVYIGECHKYEPKVNCINMLTEMMEDAYDECGEASEAWNTYDFDKPEEVEELNVEVTEVVKKWLKKYNRYPTFSAVKNIREYKVGNGV